MVALVGKLSPAYFSTKHRTNPIPPSTKITPPYIVFSPAPAPYPSLRQKPIPPKQPDLVVPYPELLCSSGLSPESTFPVYVHLWKGVSYSSLPELLANIGPIEPYRLVRSTVTLNCVILSVQSNYHNK